MELLRSLDALDHIKEDAKALRIVSAAYAGRTGMLTAVLQYVYQAVALAGKGNIEEGRAMERIASVKLYDLELLGTLIRRLGASPVYTACPPYPVSHYTASCVDYSKTLGSMIAADLALEEGMRERLVRMAGETDNADVKEVLCALLDDVDYCGARLEEMRARL